MSPDPARLLEVAAVISDRGRIDWDSLASAARDDRERAGLARLRAVAELVLAHDEVRDRTEPTGDPVELAAGQRLGHRYRVERRLGGGGMGEVWLCHDLKLCVEVALKALRPDRIGSRRRDMLRREVRAARQVVSPNVCRIFDLVEVDGLELISMEYVDGVDLRTLLRDRGPFAVAEAQEIASQLLSGLQAIHDAGIVHRDLKPANVMVTPAGRVVLMDFGIAREQADDAESTVTLAGTPAYMAPEQARGDKVDVRADVYAAGLVLLELVRDEDSGPLREALDRHDGPWRDVLLRATAEDPAARYPSARDLDRAIEAATLAAGVKEERCPFPGLAAFTEQGAPFFFGRETEVEALVRKLKRLPMIAVVGPSGVGKSSLVSAGLLPSLPETWGRIVASPGTAPFLALGQALVPHLAGDVDALRTFLRFDEPESALSLFRRWRRDHADAVVVIDQFEELFTQCPEPVQARFAELLGRLPPEADVRVVLSMRDDFLFRCHAHPGLRPILTELTLVPPLQGPELRRALIQPALACGYRFEDDALVARIVGEVERERGALPLLAFTAARLWERRDRERGLLTHAAHAAIGGVGGSLARHAEATLEALGDDGRALAREIFRALVTAQGTRLSRETDELLSLSGDRDTARDTLARLVEARLLTAFESVDPNDPARAVRRVELVHESLLSHWPRLVGWQAEDAEGARFRDRLRQASALWDEGGRRPDMLWTGALVQELRLWHGRYPGRLTRVEEAFALATDLRARRGQRRRRAAVATAVAVLAVTAATMLVLWRQSVRATADALAEARRAEAEKLYTLAQTEPIPAHALAFAIAALERSDQPSYRSLAMKITLRAPLPFRLPISPASLDPGPVEFSPGGSALAVAWESGGGLQLYSMDGGEPRRLYGHSRRVWAARFTGDDTGLVSTGEDGSARLWRVPEGTVLARIDVAPNSPVYLPRDDRVAIVAETREDGTLHWIEWALDRGETRTLGDSPAWDAFDVDPKARRIAAVVERRIAIFALDAPAGPALRVIGRADDDVQGVRLSPDGTTLATWDADGEARVWSLDPAAPEPLATLLGPSRPWRIAFSADGSHLAMTGDGATVWDLDSPGAEPLHFDDGAWNYVPAFHPDGTWLATTGSGRLVDAWSLALPRPRVLDGTVGDSIRGIQFAPDGSWVAASSNEDGTIRLWPLDGDRVGPRRTLFERPGYRFVNLQRDDGGRFLVASVLNSPVGHRDLVKVSVADGTVQVLNGADTRTVVDADGRRIASRTRWGHPIKVWDTVDGRTWDFGEPDDGLLGFLPDGRLIVSRADEIHFVDLDTMRRDTRTRSVQSNTFLCPDRKRLFVREGVGVMWLAPIDAPERIEYERLPVTVEPKGLSAQGGDPSCRIIVFGRTDGTVEVIRSDTGEVHRVPVHDGEVAQVTVDPTLRWIASAGPDGLKIWPVPTGPPTLELPYETFMAKLRAFTNLRAVPDEAWPSGYAVQGEAPPDWRHPPGW